MQLWDLKKMIVEQTVPNFLIFTGEERLLIAEYVEQIKKVFNVKSISTNTVLEAYNAGASKSLINSGKKLYIVKDDKTFMSDEVLQKKVLNNANVIILIYSSIDKKTTFYKAFSSRVVCFDKLKDDILLSALQARSAVKEEYLKWLIQACDNDYGRCINELDKVTLFEAEKQNELFAQFAKDGIIYCQIPDCIFDFSNAVIKRQVVNSISLYDDLKLRGDSPIQLFAVLYNAFRNMLLVQLSSCPSKDSTGLEEKQINGIKWNKGKYSNQELVDAVLLISELDKQIKQGVIQDNIAMEYFLARVL